jgi:hypothetical protein
MTTTKNNVDKFFKISKMENNSLSKEEESKLETIIEDTMDTKVIESESQLETVAEVTKASESQLETIIEDVKSDSQLETVIEDTSKIESEPKSKLDLEKQNDMEIEELAEDFAKINERQENKKKQLALLLEMFTLLKYEVDSIADLYNLTIQRDTLLQKNNKEKIMDLIPQLKLVYKSSYLNCLHDNSIYKQKFPAINLVRQVLKCHHLALTPKIVSNGYEKVTGKKRVNRIFIIQKQMF